MDDNFAICHSWNVYKYFCPLSVYIYFNRVLKPTIHDATKLHATVACNFVASCMLNFPCNKVANNIVACNFVASCMLKCCVQLCCTVYVDCCTQQSCMQHVAWELKIKYCMQHCCMKSVACNMLHATLLYRVCYFVACNFVARKCCMQQSCIVYGGLNSIDLAINL